MEQLDPGLFIDWEETIKRYKKEPFLTDQEPNNWLLIKQLTRLKGQKHQKEEVVSLEGDLLDDPRVSLETEAIIDGKILWMVSCQRSSLHMNECL